MGSYEKLVDTCAQNGLRDNSPKRVRDTPVTQIAELCWLYSFEIATVSSINATITTFLILNSFG